MFCNQCGTQLQSDYRVCPKCGQPIYATPVVATTSRLQKHLRTLGTLWIIVGALFLLPALAVMTFGTAASFFLPFHDAAVHAIGPFFVFLAGGTLMILGVGGVCVGWALMDHRPWARIIAIILGVLALFHPPLGTALGIYTLWVLLSNDAERQYEQLAHTA